MLHLIILEQCFMYLNVQQWNVCVGSQSNCAAIHELWNLYFVVLIILDPLLVSSCVIKHEPCRVLQAEGHGTDGSLAQDASGHSINKPTGSTTVRGLISTVAVFRPYCDKVFSNIECVCHRQQHCCQHVEVDADGNAPKVTVADEAAVFSNIHQLTFRF